MKKLIKKTIVCSLGTEMYISALMTKINFIEVDRIVFAKEEKVDLALTFEGNESDYHENDYVRVTHDNHYHLFYSINQPKGIPYNWGEDYFKNVEFQLKDMPKFEILQFKPELK